MIGKLDRNSAHTIPHVKQYLRYSLACEKSTKGSFWTLNFEKGDRQCNLTIKKEKWDDCVDLREINSSALLRLILHQSFP